MERPVRAIVLAASASLVCACGGGGDDSSGPSGGGTTTLSVPVSTLSVSATPADAAPVGNVTISVSNPPADGLFAGFEHGTNGIESVELIPVSASTAQVTIWFRSPLQVPAGIYTDTVRILVCFDDQCARPVNGSPAILTTTYTVTSPVSATIDRTTLTVTANSGEAAPPTADALISVMDGGGRTPIVMFTHTSSGLHSVFAFPEQPDTIRIRATFRTPSELEADAYSDTITVRVCYDFACVRDVNGSPFTLSTTYNVSHDIQPEPGVPALEVLSRTPLPHDVVDAEYSAALDAIVMVAQRPRNALYVYDVASGEESEIVLNKAPTSVGIAPDGLTAAVGHDALISHVALSAVGQPLAAPTLLNVSTDVFDIVLGGNGFVHAFPRADQWVDLHSVEIATNTEHRSSVPMGGFLYAGTRARLHPSGDAVYLANNGLSPDDIAKADISAGPGMLLYDSQYHGDFGMCGNLWMKEDGTRIYTACGNTFTSTTDQDTDMVYAGRMQLSESDFLGYMIGGLSQSDEQQEIALIEFSAFECGQFGNRHRCFHHLNTYDPFLNRTSLLSIPPVPVDGRTYGQRGLFVFHSADGTRLYMISRLFDVPDPDEEYSISVVR